MLDGRNLLELDERDRVAVIDRGRVIALGTPRELIASLGAASSRTRSCCLRLARASW